MADGCKTVGGRFRVIHIGEFSRQEPEDDGIEVDRIHETIDLSWGGYGYSIPFDRLTRPEEVLEWLHHLSEKEWPGMTPYRVSQFIENVYHLNGWKLYERIPHENEGPPLSDEERQIERDKLSPQLRFQVLKRDRFRCRYCGASSGTGTELHVDHIVPLAKGGRTELSNLQSLCKPCNYGKGSI